MKATAAIAGGCLCGAVRLEVDAAAPVGRVVSGGAGSYTATTRRLVL